MASRMTDGLRVFTGEDLLVALVPVQADGAAELRQP
jgi:hypothetical protein